MKISELESFRCHLGEGPVWHHQKDVLYWVDSLAPRIFRYSSENQSVENWELPGKYIGSLAPRHQGGLILALDQGFYFFDTESNQLELIDEPLAGRNHLRLNDGKVDRFGCFVAGALNIDYLQDDNCPMFHLSTDLQVTEILDGFSCFNGPCFNANGDTLYVTGRKSGVIEAFDYSDTGMPKNGRSLIANINPDGATVDIEGFIWSAQWDEGCLLRISPQGTIDYKLEIPGQIVSSVMFGGQDLRTIYVTTIGETVHGATPGGVHCGKLLIIEDTGFQGQPELEYRG
ncbi:MAG: L-arabinonolactonase [Parasphingorhabdus sp.]|jgi:L-arabinonolactonase